MLKNYILLALRNLAKNRLFSGINILGLGLSMGVCLFILLLVRSAYEYDKFHPDGERVFRVNTKALRKDGGGEPYATSPYPVGAALAAGFSQVEAMTRLAASAPKKSAFGKCSVHRPGNWCCFCPGGF